MPTTANLTPTLPPETITVTLMVNGDAVNSNNLVLEVSPGADPYLTLTLLGNWITGLRKYAPDLGLTTLAENSLMLDSTTGAGLTPGSYPPAINNTIQQMLTSLKHGMSLSQVAFWAIPTGHSSGLPVTMPTFTVVRQAIATGIAVSIGPAVTDPSANHTVYDTAHAITCPITAGNGPGGTSEIVDLTQYFYYGGYLVENGTRAVTTIQLMGAISTVSYT